MKRLASLLVLAALICALALPAAADVAYMPRDNFIEKHWDECSYVNRWFWTNGEAGYVLAHKTPDSKEATPLPNGGKYYISNVYQGKWGVLEYDPDTLENTLWNGSVSGWVEMSEMVADYDNESFMADHSKELVWEHTAAEAAALEWEKGESLYAYKYPGSGEVTETFDPEWHRGDPIPFSALFTDPAGRRWGYCDYFYGWRNLWICIDDPYNGALPPDENCVTIVTRPAAPAPTEPPTPTEPPEPTGTPEPTEAPKPSPTAAPVGKTVELTPSADPQTLQQAAKDNRGSGPYIAAGACGVVVVAAAVLLAALRKKRK